VENTESDVREKYRPWAVGQNYFASWHPCGKYLVWGLFERHIDTIRTIRRLFTDYSYYSSTIRTIRTIRFTILVLSIATHEVFILPYIYLSA
jgi:hypothetical protein